MGLSEKLIKSNTQGGIMLKNRKVRILFTLGVGIVLYLTGCVDTSVQPIPDHFDFRSQVNIVNVAEGVSQAEVSLVSKDGSTVSFGNIAFGAESPAGSFTEVAAGSKTMIFKHSGGTEEFKITADTDRKIRYFVFGPAGERDVFNFVQRYTFQTKGSPNSEKFFPKDSCQIAFFNGSSDATIDGFIAVASGIDTTVAFPKTIGMGKGAAYSQIKAADYRFYVISGSDTLTTFTAKLDQQKRYTAVIYDATANIKSKVFTDD